MLISDGGLATELEARGHDLSDPLWSARLLADAPQEIVAVHAAYFRAGATIATTASYQASFEGFAARGIGRDEAVGLLRRSVELAKTARDEVGADDAWVAASVGPYGAALADGSEYRGRYGLSVAHLARWHRPRLEVLAAAGADVLALETVPDVDEAEALVTLVQSLGVPAWLSYTIDGTRTRAGQPLAEAFAVAAGVPEIVAVGVNCCAPDDVLPAIGIGCGYWQTGDRLPQQRRALGRPARAWIGPSRFSAQLAAQWVAAGRASSADAAGCGPPTSPMRRTALHTLGGLRGELPVLQNGVDDPVVLGLFCGQDLVPVGVLADHRGVLAGVVGQRGLHQRAHPLDLGGLDLQIGELTLDHPGQRRLVDQHPRVGQRHPLTRRSGGQQHRRRRGGLAQTHRLDVGPHVLHRVVDRHQRGEPAARRVDVHGDVAVGVQRLQHQQLGHDVVRRRVVDLDAEEDDALLEQLVVGVGLLDAEAGMLDERRQDVARLGLDLAGSLRLLRWYVRRG